jgi:hypothetical protein
MVLLDASIIGVALRAFVRGPGCAIRRDAPNLILIRPKALVDFHRRPEGPDLTNPPVPPKMLVAIVRSA